MYLQHDDLRRWGNPPTTAEVRRLCTAHRRLDPEALRALAPIAGNGHAAHLHLHATDQRLNADDRLPVFLARSAQAARMDWQLVARIPSSPELRTCLEAWYQAGMTATTHLVQLAEPLIRCAVDREWHVSHNTSVIDLDDMINVGRLAVASGVWAYDPRSVPGTGFLRLRVEENLKREFYRSDRSMSVPGRTMRRFARVAAIRNRLCASLGREPDDIEVVDHSGGSLTLADVELERECRHRLDGDAEPGVEGVTADVEVDVGPSGWREVLRVLELDETAVEIVSRLAGLPPFEDLDPRERSERQVALCTGVTRASVRAVRARLRRATCRDGRVRRFLCELSVDDREGLGLQRMVQMLDNAPA